MALVGWLIFSSWSDIGDAQTVRHVQNREGLPDHSISIAALNPVGFERGWGRVRVQDAQIADVVHRSAEIALSGLDPNKTHVVQIEHVDICQAFTDEYGQVFVSIGSEGVSNDAMNQLAPASDLVVATVLDESGAVVLEGKFANVRQQNSDLILRRRVDLVDLTGGSAVGMAAVEISEEGFQRFIVRASGLAPYEQYLVVANGVDTGIVTADVVGQASLDLMNPSDQNPLPERIQPVDRIRSVSWYQNGEEVLSGFFGVNCDGDANRTPERMTLNPKSKDLDLGDQIRFDAAIWDQCGDRIGGEVYWEAAGGTIDQSGVYDAGSVPGDFNVTVRGPAHLTQTATVTLLDRSSVESVTVSPGWVRISTSDSIQLEAQTRDASNTLIESALHWDSSNPLAATVTREGVVHGIAAGTSTIIATSDGVSGSATIKVVADDNPTPPADCSFGLFSEDSPWNTPISEYSSVTYEQTNALSSFNSPAFSPWPQSASVAIWEATENDPLTEIYFHPDAWIKVANGQWKRYGNSAQVEAEIRQGMDQNWLGYQANQYSTTDPNGYSLPDGYKPRVSNYWSTSAYVPAGALPSPDADGHLAIFQPNGWVLEVNAAIMLSTGEIVGLFASYTDSSGAGDGLANGRRASMIPNYAGVLRDGELSSGHIDHALCLAVGPEALAKEYWWPATAMDRNPSDYTGSLAMGALLAIPSSVDVNSIGLSTEEGKTVAQAARDYGMYVVDRSGSNGFVLCTELNVSDVPSWNYDLERDLKRIRDQLHVVQFSP